MIETADAFFKIRDILRASDRIVATNIGGEDFALDCNFQPTGEALFYPKQHMVIAATAANVIPLGFVDSIAGFGDFLRQDITKQAEGIRISGMKAN